MSRLDPSKLERARQLRWRQTPAERRAWQLLRNRRLLGLKFRRQHRIRGFIVDFYCHELQLVLEIDIILPNRQCMTPNAPRFSKG